jgi:voltage-gated potassium channel
MWWAFTTLTTVGYGDVTPITIAGKTFGALITVVGVGMVALPTAILASAFSEQLHLRAKKYENMADIAYEDGVLTEDEQKQLDLLREELGLTKGIADEILAKERDRINPSSFTQSRKCPHCGYELDSVNQDNSVALIKAM